MHGRKSRDELRGGGGRMKEKKEIKLVNERCGTSGIRYPNEVEASKRGAHWPHRNPVLKGV
jgi:hypothetical protein